MNMSISGLIDFDLFSLVKYFSINHAASAAAAAAAAAKAAVNLAEIPLKYCNFSFWKGKTETFEFIVYNNENIPRINL